LTTYIINLIKMRSVRFISNVVKIREFEDTSEEAQEKLNKHVYNQVEDKNLDAMISLERFFEAVEEELTGLDLEFFRLEVQNAEPDEFIQAVVRANDFPEPSIEAKNRRARVRRILRKIANHLGYTLSNFIVEK
jgi:hypothetical protein